LIYFFYEAIGSDLGLQSPQLSRFALMPTSMKFWQVSGKMRKHSIRILLGDRVSIEMSPYDSLAAELLIVTVSWNQHLGSSDWPRIQICCYG
jgi:hypothetical protein